MNPLFKKIKSWFSFAMKRKSVHYKNIKSGKTLTIDGKKYVKVKLQFVDTLDYKASKTMEDLQVRSSSLTKRMVELKEKITLFEKENRLLRILNTNLLNSEKTESARLKSEIKKLKKPEEKLKRRIQLLERKNERQAIHITGLDNINLILKQKLMHKTDSLEQFEQQDQNIPLHAQMEKTRKMNKRLNEKVSDLTEQINSLKKQLSIQEILNKNLMAKISKGLP